MIWSGVSGVIGEKFHPFYKKWHDISIRDARHLPHLPQKPHPADGVRARAPGWSSRSKRLSKAEVRDSGRTGSPQGHNKVATRFREIRRANPPKIAARIDVSCELRERPFHAIGNGPAQEAAHV